MADPHALLSGLTAADLFAPFSSSPPAAARSPSPPPVTRNPSAASAADDDDDDARRREMDALLDGVRFDDFWSDEAGSLPPTPVKPKPQRRPPPAPALLALRPPAAPAPEAWRPRPWARCVVRKSSSCLGAVALECEVVRCCPALAGSEGWRVGVELKDEWLEWSVKEGDTVNLVSPLLPALLSPSADGDGGGAHIDKAVLRLSSRNQDVDNLLVLHPDVLVPATSLSTALSCPRRAALRALVRSAGGGSKALVEGNVLHAVVQDLLGRSTGPEGGWGEGEIDRAVDRALGESAPVDGGAEGAQEAPADPDAVKGEVFRAGLDGGWEALVDEVRERARAAFSEFGRQFVAPDPHLTASSSFSSFSSSSSKPPLEALRLRGLHAIEEDLRSPLWGMQGKVDVSVQVSGLVLPAHLDPLSRTTSARSASASTSRSTSLLALPQLAEGKSERALWDVPFELKTGRAIGGSEHRAQTSVYCLLMEERYSRPVPQGLLYYSQQSQVHPVPLDKRDVRALVGVRNGVAWWEKRRGKVGAVEGTEAECAPASQTAQAQMQATADAGAAEGKEKDDAEEEDDKRRLPPTIDQAYACSRCYQVDVCMLYRTAVEQTFDSSSPIAPLYAFKTSHLTPAHQDWFKKWEALVTLEEESAGRFGREVWAVGGEERERLGRCFNNMVLVPTLPLASVGPSGSGTTTPRTRIHRHTYTFARVAAVPVDPHAADAARPSSLLNGHIAVNDPVAISLLDPCGGGGLVSIARGFVLALECESVTVGLDGELDERVLRERLDAREAFTAGGRSGGGYVGGGKLRFRVDKDELASGMGRIRDNLVQLFLPPPAPPPAKPPTPAALSAAETAARLRATIVDLAPPSFDPLPTAASLPASLNPDQQRAVRTVLAARDFALVLGMPGTGKTTTIAEVVRALVREGKSVLLTAYTHSAVDTIVRKLAEGEGMGILRLGNPDKVHPEVAKFTLGARGPAQSMDEYAARLLSPRVVATTALSIDHPLFAQRMFDVCIVDEASQITLPVCLGPLRFARTFVLVGDHFQLPPLVKNPTARKAGLETSLFRLLHGAHPQATVSLARQYRMNAPIMAVANALVYGGRLVCGDEGVARARLEVPRVAEVERLLSDGEDGGEGVQDWLQKVLDPECKAIFLNTDLADLTESRVGDLVQNVGEAHVVQILQALLAAGVRPSQLAAITLYRQQIKLLERTLAARDVHGVEVLTADKSQGRDKDCVLVSMVRSNKHGSVGELLRDWRRVNVALTRARRKLVVLGSRTTLAADGGLARLLALMDAHGQVVDLPDGVLGQHGRLAHLRLGKEEVGEDRGSVAVKEEEEEAGGKSAGSPAAALRTPPLATPTSGRKRPSTRLEFRAEPDGKDAAAAAESAFQDGPAAAPTPTRARPKRARLTAEALVKGRPLLKDVLNELNG